MASKYPRSRQCFKEDYGLLLTDEQIEVLAAQDEVTAQDIKVDGLSDSMPREIIVQLIVWEVLGKRKLKTVQFGTHHWPVNCDDDKYTRWFFHNFPLKAEKKGYRTFKRYWKP